IDLDRSFLDSGGDSISALRLLRRYRGAFSLQTILDRSTALQMLKELAEGAEELKPSDGEDGVSDVEYRMWKIIQQSAHPAAYNVGIEFDLKGDVDVERLVAAIEQVLLKVDSVHSSYCSDSASVNKQRLPVRVKVEEGSSLEVSCKEVFHPPFNLEDPPLARMAYVRGDGCVTLLFCASHLVIDGLGICALFNAVSHAYAGRPWQVSPSMLHLPSQKMYADALRHWKELFKEPLGAVSWPGGLAEEESFGVLSIGLSAQHVASLQETALELGTTLPWLLLAFYKIALFQVGLGADLVVGFPVANRSSDTAQSVVANLSNTLLIRSVLDSKMGLHAFIKQVCQQGLAALEHEEVSIDRVLREVFADPSEADGLFDVLFSYLDIANGALEIEGCLVERRFALPVAPKAALVCSAIENSDASFELRLEYDNRRLSRRFAAAILQAMELGLQHIEDMEIAALPRLTPAQKALVASTLTPSLQSPNGGNLVAMLERTCIQHGSREALVYGEKVVRYDELWRRALTLADGLRTSGVCEGSPVGVSLGHSDDLIVALLGVLVAGCHYVPLDPRNSAERNDYITENSAIRCVLDENRCAALEREGNPEHTAPCKEAELAYVIYTSGTTGKPKGVAVTHCNVASLFEGCQPWAQFSEQDVWTLFHSYAFDFSVWEIFGALLHGGKLIILPEAEIRDPMLFAGACGRHGVSVINQTPTAFRNLLAVAPDFSNLPRLVIFGGEALSMELVRTWWRRYPTADTQLVNMYGITEVTVHATWQVMHPQLSSISIGRPLDHVGMLVVDAWGRPAVPGAPGELWVTGSGIARGYVNNPELTKSRFITRSFVDEPPQRYYKTGDLGVLSDDGSFTFLGRSDTQLKINGYRIEASEVQGALNSVEGIAASHVGKWVEEDGSQVLIAYYTGDRSLSEPELRNLLTPLLPFYAIPSYFVCLEQFPLTVNGKIDLDRLPGPTPQGSEVQEESLLGQVKGAWCAILGVVDVATDRGFFEMGGSSLKAVLLVSRINALFPQYPNAMSIVDVFRYPNIEHQVQALERRLLEEGVNV
ncbi:MAG: amino acid adenylation domain-containing protein, partial [Chlamydiia bacterium]|nr:amino acid adenylation domain-containing protein [Chlamydiia bacterium]